MAALAATGATLFGVAASDGGLAQAQNDDKVTICHRTNSNTNPYVMITVSKNAVDGGDDRGDHRGEHQGPVWNPTLKEQKIEWGDIIPAFTHEGVSFPGVNLADGQAILDNDCELEDGTTSPTGTLVIDKVVNNNGNTAFTMVEGDFDFDVSFGGNVHLDNVAEGTHTGLAAGVHTVVEVNAQAGYTTAFSGACSGAGTTGTVTVIAGQTVTCTVTNTAPQAQVTFPYNVTINKYLDGELATVPFDLLIAYDGVAETHGQISSPGEAFVITGTATSVNWAAGYDYSVEETGVDGSCDPGDTYALEGYSWSTVDMADAADNAPSMTIPSIVDGDSDYFIAIHNVTCASSEGPFTVTIGKFVDGALPTEGSFDMTATWDATNIGAGTSPYVIDADGFPDGTGPWLARTAEMATGFDYSTSETGIDETCDSGDTYRLAGYSKSNVSLAAAAGMAPSMDASAHAIVDGTANWFIAVHNELCDGGVVGGTSTVTIIKHAGDAAGSEVHFSVTGIVGLESGFDLDDDDATLVPLHVNVLAGLGGQFSISEDDADGWMLDSITCEEGNSADLTGLVTVDETTGTVDFDLAEDAGLSITCTFVNVEEADGDNSVTIIKDAGGSADADVAFSTSGMLDLALWDDLLDDEGGFLLDDDDDSTLDSTVTFSGMTTGGFSITEDGADGWMLDSITCEVNGDADFDLTGIADVDEDTGTVTFDFEGQTDLDVTCTFVNVEESDTTPTVTPTASVTQGADNTSTPTVSTTTTTTPSTNTPTSTATNTPTPTATAPIGQATEPSTFNPGGGSTGDDSAVAGARPDVLAPSTGTGTSQTERAATMSLIIMGLVAISAGATLFTIRRSR